MLCLDFWNANPYSLFGQHHNVSTCRACFIKGAYIIMQSCFAKLCCIRVGGMQPSFAKRNCIII